MSEVKLKTEERIAACIRVARGFLDEAYSEEDACKKWTQIDNAKDFITAAAELQHSIWKSQ